MPKVPNEITVDYSNQAVILDTILVESTSNKLGTYLPIEPGAPFKKGTHTAKQLADFADAEFLGQKATADDEWMQRYFGRPPSTQDIANWEASSAEEADGYPIFQRRYLEKRDSYAKRAAMSALPGLYRINVTGAVTVFTTPPAISFAGGTGSGATAIAVLNNAGLLSKIILKAEGNYTAVPSVVIAGGAGGDTAVASIQPATCLLTKEVTTKAEFPYDSLYLVAARLYETLPGPILATDKWDDDAGVDIWTYRQKVVTATASLPAIDSAYLTGSIAVRDHITALVVADPGSNYIALPTLTLAASPGGGTQATGTVASLKVVSAIPAALGSGYAAGDTITMTGGTASTNAVLSVGTVALATLALNAAGTGYNSGDTITLFGGVQVGAATVQIATTKLVSASLNAAGTGMVAGTTVLTLVGGTFTTAATYSVTHTKVVGTPTIAVAGTGGSDGARVATGTTGTGTKFAVAVTVAGGVITAVGAVSIVGDYTVNPTNIASEPVSVTGGGLADARLSVTMGALTIVLVQGGAYTVNSTTFTTTGGGNDAALNAGVFGIGTFTIIAGGAFYTSSSTFTQASVSPVGGLGATFQTATYTVLTLTISNAGVYTVVPGNPTAQGSTSGAGSGLTAVLNFGIGTTTITNAGTLYYVNSPAVTLSFGNALIISQSDALVILTGQTAYVIEHDLIPIDANTSTMVWVTSPLPPTLVYYYVDYTSIPTLLFGVIHRLQCDTKINTTPSKRGGNSQLRTHRRTITYSRSAPSSFIERTWITIDIEYRGQLIAFAYNNVLCDAFSFNLPVTIAGCTYYEQYSFGPTVPSASGFAGNYYTLADKPQPWLGAMFKTIKDEFLA